MLIRFDYFVFTTKQISCNRIYLRRFFSVVLALSLKMADQNRGDTSSALSGSTNADARKESSSSKKGKKKKSKSRKRHSSSSSSNESSESSDSSSSESSSSTDSSSSSGTLNLKKKIHTH